MEGTTASDEVIDEVALIEMLRQETEKRAGLAVSGSEALRKLNELREREQKVQPPENPAVRQANLDTLAAAIRRVQYLTGIAGGNGPGPRNARPSQPQPPRKGAPHNPSRNKGRRAAGRQGRP